MAIADRLNKLKTDIEDTYQAINEIGGTIPSDKNTNNIPEAIRSVYNNLPKVSDTGTNVSLSPTLKGRLGIVPKGNTLQDGEPTPDTPVEIQSATGTQKVVVSGKNLVDIESDTKTINNYYYDNTSLGFTITEDMVDKKMSFSFDIEISNLTSSATVMYGSIGYGDNNFATNWGQKSYSNISAGKYNLKIESRTITSAMIGKKLYARFLGFNQPSTATYNATNIQLEKGSTATPYQPYQEPQEVDIELSSIELNKIGDYEDYIDGTPDNWVLYRNIGKVVLDGSILFDKQDAWSNVGNNTNAFYKGYTAFDNMKPNSVVMSDNFVYLSNIVTNDSYGIYLTTNLIIRVPKAITNKSELNNWLSTHNVEIIYPLAETQQTPITDTNLISQLNELYYLMSYNDTTNIDVTGNLPMRITASAIKGE